MATPPSPKSSEDIISTIIRDAVFDRASDIHIEPLEREFRIRFRIDGVLHEKQHLPLYELESLSNRIKVLANLEIAGHNFPQDGHFTIMIRPPETGAPTKSNPSEQTESGQAKTRLSETLSHLLFNTPSKAPAAAPPSDTTEHTKSQAEEPLPPPAPLQIAHLISLRVSVFPTLDGDSIVMRLLNREGELLRLEQLGMDDATLALFRRLIAKDYGMVLVTGPSGAGKTTTLYSLIETLRSKEKNIVTLEDPVELRLDEIRQSQIFADHGLTFASGMRSILRQDPDIIMIGEIRDPETAENAVRASLTGRVVLSTIHANTTLGTIPRLIDMNVERSLIAYALNGVVAQRLVRKICPDCRVNYTPHQEFLTYFNIDPSQHTFVKGSGCETCHHTGYRGRTGLFEVLYFDDTVQTMIIEKAPMKALEEYVAKSGMKSLKQAALEKVFAGITTIEEAGKVV